jgi:hypothetical protein
MRADADRKATGEGVVIDTTRSLRFPGCWLWRSAQEQRLRFLTPQNIEAARFCQGLSRTAAPGKLRISIP